jgi:hypothetical protein
MKLDPFYVIAIIIITLQVTRIFISIGKGNMSKMKGEILFLFLMLATTFGVFIVERYL